VQITWRIGINASAGHRKNIADKTQNLRIIVVVNLVPLWKRFYMHVVVFSRLAFLKQGEFDGPEWKSRWRIVRPCRGETLKNY
jgi:hypothetical protein